MKKHTKKTPSRSEKEKKPPPCPAPGHSPARHPPEKAAGAAATRTPCARERSPPLAPRQTCSGGRRQLGGRRQPAGARRPSALSPTRCGDRRLSTRLGGGGVDRRRAPHHVT